MSCGEVWGAPWFEAMLAKDVYRAPSARVRKGLSSSPSSREGATEGPTFTRFRVKLAGFPTQESDGNYEN